MKKSLSLLILGTLLCSCQSNQEPKYCVGEWADVHEHYQAMVVSEPTTEQSLNYLGKDGSEKIAEENGKTFVRVDVVLKRDNDEGKAYKLDADDFKLSDRKGTFTGGLKDQPAYADYAWVGNEVKPGDKIDLALAFLVNASKVDQYEYLEIDFRNSPNNSTSIYLKTRAS